MPQIAKTAKESKLGKRVGTTVKPLEERYACYRRCQVLRKNHRT